jgi:hypothetical protein
MLGLIVFAAYYSVMKFKADTANAGQPLSKALLFSIVAAGIIYLGGVICYAWFGRAIAKTLAVVVLSFVTVTLFINVQETAKSISDDHGQHYYGKGMQWVRENVPEGEMVFNTDWDDFPKMFFYDTKHSYASGLDPTYLLDKNPELSKLYEQITLGKEKDPGPIIRERFGARYVFTDNEDIHNDFYYNALQSGWFDKVYEDEECTVLRIRDQKGEAPPEAEEDEDAPTEDETDEPEDSQ